MSTIYRGHGQSGGFGDYHVTVEDPSEKIRQEGQRWLTAWRSRSDYQNRNAQAWLKQLDAKADAEQANRDSNRDLHKSFAKSFFEAEQKNIDIGIENTNRQLKQTLNNAKQLAPFSPKILEAAGQLLQKRAASQSQIGERLGFEFGITSQQQSELQALQGSIRDYEGKNVAVINDLLSKGATWQQIGQIKNLSGYGRLGLRKAEVINKSEQYGAFLVEKFTQPVELPGIEGPVSLASAHKDRNFPLQERIIQEHRSTFLKDLSHLNPEFVLDLAREKMMRAEGRLVSATVKARSGDIQQQVEDEDLRSLLVDFKEHGPEGYFSQIELKGGLHTQGGKYMKGAVAQQHNNLLRLIEEGHLNAVDIEELGDHVVKYNDSDSGQKYKYRNPIKFQELNDALVEQQKKKAEELGAQVRLDDNRMKMRALEAEQYIVANYESITPQELYAAYNQAAKTRNPYLMKAINRRLDLTQEGVNDTINEPMLYKMLNKGLLSRTAVIDAGLSPEKTNEWLKKADENDAIKPTNAETAVIKSTIKGAVEGELKRYGFESKQVATAALAVEGEYDTAINRFYDGMVKFNGNRTSALNYALQEFQRDVENGSLEVGEVQLKNGVSVRQPFFKKYQLVPGDLAPYPLSQYTIESVRKNPNLSKTEAILSPAVVEGFFRDANNGIFKGYPPTASHFVTKYIGLKPDGTPRMTELQFMLDQNEALGLNLNIPKGLEELTTEAYTSIRPELRRLITGSHVTKDSVNVAMTFSGLKTPYITEKEDHTLNLLSSPDSETYGYNTVGLEGNINHSKATLGKNVTSMTVGEIKAAQSQGLINTIGRYQFTPEVFLEFIDKLGLTDDVVFTQRTQDKIALLLLKDQGPDSQLLNINEDITDEDLDTLRRYGQPVSTSTSIYRQNEYLSPLSFSLLYGEP